MAHIEPAVLKIEITGENVSLNMSNQNLESLRWPRPHIWTLNKLIDDGFEIVDGEIISSKIQSVVEGLYENIETIDSDVANLLVRSVMLRISGGRFDNGIVLYRSDVFILPSSRGSGHMFFISSDQANIDTLIDDMHSRIEDISEIASDFGLDIQLLSGEPLAEMLSEELDSEVIDRKDFDNEFEKQVYEDIEANLTRCLDDNVVLRFGKEDPEIFEYDIIIHLDGNARIILEVKDESHNEANLGKPKLIDTPRDKSDIIDSGETRPDTQQLPVSYRPRIENLTECFVIVNEMDDPKFEQHKQQASRRDINIIKYDTEGNYIEKIENSMKDSLRT